MVKINIPQNRTNWHKGPPHMMLQEGQHYLCYIPGKMFGPNLIIRKQSDKCNLKDILQNR